MGICVPEKTLHEAWRRADMKRSVFGTADGEQYRVLYSGMPGGSFGPDFRDAVLEAVDGSELQGDVEIHREASEWYTHGHNGDGRYGRVIFHLVGSDSDSRVDTLNSLGMTVPEARIGNFIHDAGEHVFEREVRRSGHESEGVSVGDWLDAAGDERFALKVKSARIDMESLGPDLALQLAVFECLGYPRNRHAFRHLAKRLPWAFLAGLASFEGRYDASNEERSEALLSWAAGLGERPHWVPVERLLGGPPEWVAAAGRPANRIENRLAAAARIVVKWWYAGGPMRHLLGALRRANSTAGLRDAYCIEGGLLGTGRAGEIVVNAVLPVLSAWAEVGRDSELYAETMRLYRSHPALPSNSVFEEAKRVLLRRGVLVRKVRGARQQQGVMHIYKSMLLRPRVPRQMRLGRRALSS